MQPNEISVEQIIKDGLSAAGVLEINGAALGEMLADNGIAYKEEAGTLAKFLAAFAPNLNIVGRAGSDRKYSFNAVGTDAASDSEYFHPLLWREFAGISGRHNIAWDEQNNVCIVLQPEASVLPGMVAISRMSKTELANIALMFLELQAPGTFGPKDAEIRQAIREDSPNWFTLLKSASPAQVQPWNEFRIAEIEKTFESRILLALKDNESAVDKSELVARALKQLRRSRLNMHPTRKENTGSTPFQRTELESDIRSLAISVISKMSEAELSQLWVPLGSVFEKINKAK